jgi:hypothetical protein
MSGRADLHLHTTHSDGTLSEQELVKRAKAAGLATISVTDHDSVSGIDGARAAGQECGVDVVNGVELSVSVDGQDIHLLAYFFDHTNQNLLDHLSFFRHERVKRAERIVGKLNALNLPLKLEAVLTQAGSGSVGRPHIANALVDQGLIETYHEAFYKYIGLGKPAYEQKIQVSPRDAIEMVASAGGLTFLAHPGNSIGDEILIRLIKEGIDGIEIIHPSHTQDRVSYYNGIVNQYYLLASGGSDFHGGKRNDVSSIGRYWINLEQVEAMRRRLDHP